jgi:TPR repeat protein
MNFEVQKQTGVNPQTLPPTPLTTSGGMGNRTVTSQPSAKPLLSTASTPAAVATTVNAVQTRTNLQLPGPVSIKQTYQPLNEIMRDFDAVDREEKKLKRDEKLYGDGVKNAEKLDKLDKEIDALDTQAGKYSSQAMDYEVKSPLLKRFYDFLASCLTKRKEKLEARRTEVTTIKARRTTLDTKKTTILKNFQGAVTDWKAYKLATSQLGTTSAQPAQGQQLPDDGPMLLDLLRSWNLCHKKCDPKDKEGLLHTFFDNFRLIDNPQSKQAKEYNALLKKTGENISLPETCTDAALILKFGSMYEKGSIVTKNDASAYVMYEQAAKLNNANAKFRMGVMELEGRGVAQNVILALTHLKDCAAHGNLKAQYELGRIYEHGLGVVKDLDTAMEWYSKAAKWDLETKQFTANDGDPMAMNSLGNMYEKGQVDGVVGQASDTSAETLYKQASLSKIGTDEAVSPNQDPQGVAYLNLGKLYGKDRNRLGDSENNYKKSAEKGNPEGSYRYAQKLAYNLLEYEKAASQGNPGALKAVGDMYLNGTYEKPKDIKKAREYYQQSADAGCAAGMCALGKMLLKTKDDAVGRCLIQSAADRADPDALLMLCELYEELDPGRASEVLQLLDSSGNNLISKSYVLDKAKDDENYQLYKEGCELQKEGNNAEAIKKFVQAATAGYTRAAKALGDIYKPGDISAPEDQSPKIAARCYFKGASNAKLPDPDCMVEYANLCHQGRGVEKNDTIAEKFFTEAANLGNARAMIGLGKMFLGKDNKKAFEWFQKAAEGGNSEGMRELAKLYRDGKFVRKDEKNAAHWFKKAADLGDAESQVALGDMYRDGKGVKKDIVQATQLYNQALGKNEFAWYRLNILETDGKININKTTFPDYRTVEEVEKDYYRKIQSEAHMPRPTDTHIAMAKEPQPFQLTIARKYEHGRGVKKDFAEAFKYYQEAAKLGSIEALCKVAECYVLGKGVEPTYEKAIGIFTNLNDTYSRIRQEKSNYTLYSKHQLGSMQSQMNQISTGLTRLHTLIESRLAKDPNNKALDEKRAWLGFVYSVGYGNQQPQPVKAAECYRTVITHGNQRAFEIFNNEFLKTSPQDSLQFMQSLEDFYAKESDASQDTTQKKTLQDQHIVWLTKAAELEAAKRNMGCESIEKLKNAYESSARVEMNQTALSKWQEELKNLNDTEAEYDDLGDTLDDSDDDDSGSDIDER